MFGKIAKVVGVVIGSGVLPGVVKTLGITNPIVGTGIAVVTAVAALFANPPHKDNE